MPKQEELISMIEDFDISKIGVGAVFEWVAETKKQAPVVIQKIGFEWLFRLLTEPKRLWKRYFLILFICFNFHLIIEKDVEFGFKFFFTQFA